MRQKKILIIQDISCTGRCSITVALPLLSAAGIETAIVPTSILSTHTGGFVGYHHRDLTQDMNAILEHWETLDLHFDAIYVGFLANEAQVDNTLHMIARLRDEDTRLYVDPAMADEGTLYALLPSEFPQHMRRLCEIADVIVPNMTESFLLLGEEYREGPYRQEEIERMIHELSEINHGCVVMTGVYQNEKQMGAACYDPHEDWFHVHYGKKIPGIFYGTGDVFMSVLVGALMNEQTISNALVTACTFVIHCIERNVDGKTDYRYGVNFEQGIPELLKLLGKL